MFTLEAGRRSGPLSRLVDGLLGRLARETTSGRFIPEIDGLRFVAIALVFFSHVHAYTAIKSAASLRQCVLFRACREAMNEA
jgi:hypothetical protein